MKQKDKDLLLKDFCARLSYNLVVQIEGCGIWNLRGVDHDDSSELRDRVIVWHKNYPSSKNSFPIIECKPFLFPLSSMTEEQYNSLTELGILSNCSHSLQYVNPHIHGVSFILNGFKTYSLELIDWLNKHHFDYQGLITKGLAIDCTNLNIY